MTWLRVTPAHSAAPGDILAHYGSVPPHEETGGHPERTVIETLASDVIRTADLSVLQRTINGLDDRWIRAGSRESWSLWRKGDGRVK